MATRVLPAVPVSVLPYGNASSVRTPPLVRAGGVIGFAAFALVLLYVPCWWDGPHLGLYANLTTGYVDALRAVPLVQMFGAGAGVALLFAGRPAGRRSPAYLLALTFHVLTLAGVAYEMGHPPVPVRFRGYMLSNYE